MHLFYVSFLNIFPFMSLSRFNLPQEGVTDDVLLGHWVAKQEFCHFGIPEKLLHPGFFHIPVSSEQLNGLI
jgi:hypothetical protein